MHSPLGAETCGKTTKLTVKKKHTYKNIRFRYSPHQTIVMFHSHYLVVAIIFRDPPSRKPGTHHGETIPGNRPTGWSINPQAGQSCIM